MNGERSDGYSLSYLQPFAFDCTLVEHPSLKKEKDVMLFLTDGLRLELSVGGDIQSTRAGHEAPC